MYKLISYFIFLVFFSSCVLPYHVNAQETMLQQMGAFQTTPGKITPVFKTKLVPYDGVLFSSEAVAWILAQQSMFQERIEIERDNATLLATTECKKQISDLKTGFNADKNIYDVQLKFQQKNIDVLNKTIKELEDNGNNNYSALYVGGGALGGILLTLATVFIISNITK